MILEKMLLGMQMLGMQASRRETTTLPQKELFLPQQMGEGGDGDGENANRDGNPAPQDANEHDTGPEGIY